MNPASATCPDLPWLTVQPQIEGDIVRVHIGGELDVTPTFSVRAGVMIDPSPSPADTLTPDVPDSSRINIAGINHANVDRVADSIAAVLK